MNIKRSFYTIFTLLLLAPSASQAVPLTGYLTGYCVTDCWKTWQFDSASRTATQMPQSLSTERGGLAYRGGNLYSLSEGGFLDILHLGNGSVTRTSGSPSANHYGLDFFGDTLVGAGVVGNRGQLEIFSIDTTSGSSSNMYSYSGFSTVGSITTLNASTLLLSAMSAGSGNWGLYSVDYSSGSMSLVGGLDSQINAMDVGMDGVLYGFANASNGVGVDVFTIDTNTASQNYLYELSIEIPGLGIGDLMGVALANDITVPEPNILVVFLLGLFGLAFSYRHTGKRILASKV